MPAVSSAISRLTAPCISGGSLRLTVLAVLGGIVEWSATARALFDEVKASFPGQSDLSVLTEGMAARGVPEPAHLAAVFACLTGRKYRTRMRSRLRQAQSEQGIAMIEAHVESVLAAEPDATRHSRLLVVDLAVIAASGTMRPEHEALLERFLGDSCVEAPHAAYALWLLKGTRAADRVSAILSLHIADAYNGPTYLGYLAEMGPDATGALGVIDALLARRRRLTVNDPDRRYELRTDERLCAAARSARQSITAAL